MGRIAVTGCALIVGTAVLVGPSPAAAFLEFLFGRPAAPQAPPQVGPPSLDVRVTPKRKPRHGKKERDPHKVASSAPPVIRQTPMNPKTNPDWYLKDPNIRFGDILILETGPVVYQGKGKTRSREDFVALRRSHLSKTGARDIGMMAAGIWIPDDPPALPADRPTMAQKAR